MENKSVLRRYPFVIADEEGDVLYSSVFCGAENENIFSPDRISFEDLRFFREQILAGRYFNLILVEDQSSKNAVFIVPMLFPSVRAFVVLYADFAYSVAADYCTLHCDSVLLPPKENIKETRAHQQLYPEISAVIFSLRVMFSSDYVKDYENNFSLYLADKIREISRLTFCETELAFEGAISESAFENFDEGIFAYYILIILSASSHLSMERKALLCLSSSSDRLNVSLKIDASCDDALGSRFEERFCPAVRKLDDACLRLNLPFYYLKDGSFESSIIPLRTDVSALGLKAPLIELKYKEKNEEYHRNIFLPVSFFGK